ncbi:MAG: type II secretion system protein [bacterium]
MKYITFYTPCSMKKGFTLLEITVVVAIIILLSTIFLTNYREGEKRFALLRSAHQLAQAIRTTQESAMSSREFDGGFPQGGYGIYLEEGSNSFVLFADCDGDYSYNYNNSGSALSCADAVLANPYPYEKIEEFFLEEGVYISSISPSSPQNIVFFPPDPIIIITPSSNSVSITLTFDGGSAKTVTINSVGLIDIQ